MFLNFGRYRQIIDFWSNPLFGLIYPLILKPIKSADGSNSNNIRRTITYQQASDFDERKKKNH